MALDPVPVPHIPQWRHLGFAAPVHHMVLIGSQCSIRTARRWADRRKSFASQRDAFFRDIRIRDRNCRKERVGIRVIWRSEHLPRRPDLHFMPEIHHPYAVCEIAYERQAVANRTS